MEATGSHPFYDVEANGWKPASWLEPGDVLQTKDGTATLLAREKLEGEHPVYNITVAGTHTYFVGEGGLWVHNSCGSLKKLAADFKAYLPPATQRNEIVEWWAKKGPVKGGDINDSFFGRGRFFEQLTRITKFNTWKWTNDIKSNFKAIDFYKKSGSKNLVASLKSTKSDPSVWLNYNTKHLDELLDIEKKGQIIDKVTLKADEVWLYIAVPKAELSKWSSFSLPSKYSKIKVEIFTMDNALGI
ncbi:MAG: Hint domain-containing protein [Saprospiraceae bacterium]